MRYKIFSLHDDDDDDDDDYCSHKAQFDFVRYFAEHCSRRTFSCNFFCNRQKSIPVFHYLKMILLNKKYYRLKKNTQPVADAPFDPEDI